MPHNWRIEGSLDDGGGAEPTAFHLWATDPFGTSYCIGEFYKVTEYPSEIAAGIIDLCKSNPYTKGRMPERVWCDSHIFATRVATQHGDPHRYLSDMLRAETKLRYLPSNKDRRTGWQRVR